MPICATSTSGGKGNLENFYERDQKICAAGLVTAEENAKVEDLFLQYPLQDKVDALLHDAVIPPPKPKPPLRKTKPLDFYNNVAHLVNPPEKSKFQTLVDELKDTLYQSYWLNNVGQKPDSVPKVPKGFDLVGTTMGKKTPFHGRLYDIIMPKEPFPDKTPTCKKPGVQTNRNYRPPYSSDLIYGYKTNVNRRGGRVKCAMTDDSINLGTSNLTILSTVQDDFRKQTQHNIGEVFAPNENMKELEKDHSFGKLNLPDGVPACLSYCKLSPKKEFFNKCIVNLNKTRKCMKKLFAPNFFPNFYLNLKFADTDKTGWLPKETVYRFCINKQIRFDASFIEPLLAVLNAFDGKRIEYKTFVLLLNYKEPLTGFPKYSDISIECIDYRTTYGEMTKPDQESDERLMAGIPSGRYLDCDLPVTPDRYYSVDKIHLPDETGMKSCLNPNVMRNFNVSHRDMYSKRDEATIRRVFEASGEKLSDEEFDEIYKKAQEYHPQGWVSFESFRRALQS